MPEDVQEQQRLAARIEALVEEVAAFPDPHARETAQELVQALLDMYGEGLARLLEIIARSETSGLALIDTFANDDLLGSLFMLHGLHPLDIEARVMQALDEVRPYLKSHGGNVEFVKVEGRIAHLRLQGSCNGCPGSTNTLKLAIEEAIFKAAPDLDGLQVEGVVDPPPRPGMPVTFIPPRRNKDNSRSNDKDNGWTIVEELQTLTEGTLKVVPVQDRQVLFCLTAQTYYAYHDRCASCNAHLENARLEDTILSCSSCGRQFDVYHAGRCLDDPNLFLEPVPLLAEEGKVKVALAAQTKDDRSEATLAIHS